APIVHGDAARRRTGPGDRLSDVRDDRPERLAMHVCREAYDPLHVVTIDLPRDRAVVHHGYVGYERAADLAVRRPRHHWQIGDVLQRRHLRLWDLDLNLETVAAARVTPEVQVRVAAGRRCGNERSADVGGGDAKLSRPIAVDLDLERRVIERLRVL